MSINQINRNSIMSQTSRSYTGFGGYQFDRCDALTDSFTDVELVKYVTELRNEIRLLKLENEILENTIKRLEPALMQGVYQALDYATKASSTNFGSISKSQSSKFGLGDTFGSSRLTVSPSRASTRKSSGIAGASVIYGYGPMVNIVEMSELLSVAIDLQKENLENVRRRAAKKHAFFKAQMEEIEIRVIDTEKAIKLYKHEVLIAGWDKIAQRIPAETWIRFMTEWVKRTDRQIDKLRLRTSTLNTQYRRFKSQIKLKADLSESLRPVDFEKLSIENSECKKLIERKIQQIGQLKTLTGDANLNLVVHKKALMEQNLYLDKVLKTKNDKNEDIKKIDKEFAVIQIQADILSDKVNEIKGLRMAYKVPDVMDYVQVKYDINCLKRAIKLLQNRIHIQQIALATANKCSKAVNVTETETNMTSMTSTNIT